MDSLIDFCERLCVTETRKVVDDSLKYNAMNASGAGLEVRVTRTYDEIGVNHRKDQCQWCLDRCGENMTMDEAYRIGAFQRHEGCGCIIEYTSKKGKRTYQTGKSGPNTWLSEKEFQRRINVGIGGRKVTPQERIINAAIEMQIRDKRSLTLVDAIVDNHEALRFYTPEAMRDKLVKAGYKIETLNQSVSGFNGLTLEEDGGYIILFGNDGVFQYHPEGGIHEIAYWKVNNGRRGKHWYDTTGKERFFGKKY